MSFALIRHRLHSGRPLVLDADTCASFRARGVALDSPGALGRLLRERRDDVVAHYRAEIASRVDVLSTLTADTTPRALAEVGMQHRAAALTGLAVELALAAAAESPKPVAVAGVLGGELVSPLASDRLYEEFCEHAARLAAAGCELLIARGLGSRLELMAAITAAATTELPTWAVIETLPGGELVTGGPVGPLVRALEQGGADVVLFEVPSVDEGVAQLERARATGAGDDSVMGVLLAGGDQSLRGFPDDDADEEAWAKNALALDAARACDRRRRGYQ